jgi:carbon monoxide dehydrogenase subunit G
MLCESSRILPVPPDSVWPVLTDLRRLNDWLPVKAEITLPPGVTHAAPGVVVRVLRPSQLGMVDLEQVIGVCDPPRMLTWRNQNERLEGKPITQVKDFATTISLIGEPGGRTRVTVRSTWTPVGIMGSAASALMKPRMQKEYEQALANLEQITMPPPAPEIPATNAPPPTA